MSEQNFIRKASAIHLFCCILLINGEVQDDKRSEEAGRAYLKRINKAIQVKTTESVLASWAYESNITDENLRHQLEVSAKLANFTKEIWKETIKFPWKTFQDPDTRRQFQKFSVLGTAILSPEKYERFNKIISDMQSIYGKAKICNYYNRTDCSLQLEPELTEIFVKSRNPDELRYYWENWRNAAGRPVRQMYKEYVDLANEAAILNNFTNNAEFWLKDYEAPDFKEQVETLWEQLRPLYLQLHAYVRRRLREQYGEKHVTKRGPIPAHLLGNMWAQSWGNVFDFTAPYPGKPSTDVTPNMVEQGYTPLRMFKLAEEFFTSLGLSPMPETFWKNSILEKPNDGRDLICHASAWDFYDGKDFRIMVSACKFPDKISKMASSSLNCFTGGFFTGICSDVMKVRLAARDWLENRISNSTTQNSTTAASTSAGIGFHEAVGDVMALSVSTPKHLKKIGLLNAVEDDAESEINQLFIMALDKIAFLPFGYLMDQWRWGVFEGKITEKDYNCKWWQLREKYQGLSPSVVRTEADFDPGAKYHTVGNVPYIRYFVSFVIQFQFHRSLCIAAKEYDPNDPASKPLHKCDIYQSKEAGALLKEMLEMGSSKPWPDAMQVMTGQRKMDAHALLEYFASLQDWLEKENKRTNEHIGWESSQKVCEWEDESESVTPSLAAQGNFEDDNIAYSYAEFVRQDDNAFGVPDYLEESRPSYFALPHTVKENALRNNLHLKRKNSEYADENEGFYLTGDSGLKNKNEWDLRLHRREKLDRMKKLKTSQMFDDDNNKYTYCRNPSAPWPNTVFDLGTKKQEIERSKIQQAMQKSRGHPNEQTLGKTDGNPPPLKEEQWTKINTVNFEKKSDTTGDGAEIDGDKASNGNVKPKYAFTSEEAKKFSQENEPNNFFQSDINNSGEARNDDVLKDGREKGQTNIVLESLKKFEKLNLKPNSELIRKAEAVKNQAVEMLKTFNLTDLQGQIQEEDNYGPSGLAGSFHSNFPGQFPRGNYEKMESVAALRNLIRQSFQKSNLEKKKSLVESIPKKSVRDFIERSYNVDKPDGSFSVIPTRLLRKKLQNIQDEHRGVIRKNDEIGNGFLMLIGKLLTENDFGGSKRRRKKSYREFSSRIKTPVVYNAVVINANGKGEKMGDINDQWSQINNGMSSAAKRQRNLKTVKRYKKESEQISQSKRETPRNIFRNRFHESVNSYKYNINNRLQYFGRLRFFFFLGILFSLFLVHSLK